MAEAVRFERVSKRFLPRHERPRSLQQSLLNIVRGRGNPREEFWALKDVTFSVEKGETLGIIGPNGAGKSTILKLIARILEPTRGMIAVNGRVAALLELGAGFHPDLTGRENIFLNGSLLGLSRREMVNKVEEIIQFAELEEFIDIPVKHYSSGMLIRLGFSIATNVEADVLLVDEVLAVGDQYFQGKCLGRIGEIQKRGTTILFVSHSLQTVRNVCNKAIWLDKGVVKAEGSPEEVSDLYLESLASGEEVSLGEAGGPNRWGSREVEITGVRFLGADERERRLFQTGEKVIVRMEYQAHARIERPVFGVAIYRSDGFHISGPNTKASCFPLPWIEGKGEIEYVMEELPLLKGRYEFSALIYDYDLKHPYDHHHRLYTFRVESGELGGSYGLFHIRCRWEHRVKGDR